MAAAMFSCCSLTSYASIFSAILSLIHYQGGNGVPILHPTHIIEADHFSVPDPNTRASTSSGSQLIANGFFDKGLLLSTPTSFDETYELLQEIPTVASLDSTELGLDSAMDAIPDEFKIIVVLKVKSGNLKLDDGIVESVRLEVARVLSVKVDYVQARVVQSGDLAIELYVTYTVHLPQEMQVLVPAEKILQKLSISELNKALESTNTSAISVGVKGGDKQFQEDVNMKDTLSEARIWTMFEKEIWDSWQLPVLVASCALLLVLLVVGMVFMCFRQQMYNKMSKKQHKHVCLFPVVKPIMKDMDAIQPEAPSVYLTEESLETLKRHPIRIRTKGLLERRGSNASLTIDLNLSQENSTSGTPSQESTNYEEYLLSAGNRMSRKQLRCCLKNVKALHEEFWDIPMNHPEKVEIPGSGTKNRYRTIIPNEHSRLKLAEVNGDPLSSYINANYIKGYDAEERAYIATQGPMAHTVNDFWSMVWQEKSSSIVMITKFREKTKMKCEQYVPERSCFYGDIEVTLTSVLPRDGYTVRELYLKKGVLSQHVRHYWYTTWPDHKAPINPRQLVAMAVEVESQRCDTSGKPKGPVIVHCSAGIGRTGCFIAASIGMQQLLEENMVDVLGVVCSMRHDRGGMVQTAEQYEFVHRALCLFEQSLPDQSGE